jgi:hypothetical protein
MRKVVLIGATFIAAVVLAAYIDLIFNEVWFFHSTA